MSFSFDQRTRREGQRAFSTFESESEPASSITSSFSATILCAIRTSSSVFMSLTFSPMPEGCRICKIFCSSFGLTGPGPIMVVVSEINEDSSGIGIYSYHRVITQSTINIVFRRRLKTRSNLLFLALFTFKIVSSLFIGTGGGKNFSNCS